MIVAKFGGSSLASAEQVARVCDIVASDAARRLVVVSAPGKRGADDAKVTDLLIGLAERALASDPAEADPAQVVDRYREIQRGLGLPDAVADEIAADLRARLRDPAGGPEQIMERMKAAGEDNCARLVAHALAARGIEAHYVSPRDAGLLLSAEAGNARVLPEAYERLAALRDAPGVSIFPGFFGFTPGGETVTFKRGGSDITGAIVARAVNADLYENWTDVDAVAVADPKIIPAPRPVTELTYREMRELSYNGFGVFNDEALAPVAEVGIPVCIKNTNNPSAAGTRIVGERRFEPGSIVGVAGMAGFATIFVSKYLMNREVGFGRRLLQILEDEGIPYEHAPTGIDDISVIVREERFDEATERRVTERIARDLAPNVMWVERGFALVMVVGEGMRETRGITARAARALADAGVNIEMLNQGASQVSVTFGVWADKHEVAVRALYEEFFGG